MFSLSVQIERRFTHAVWHTKLLEIFNLLVNYPGRWVGREKRFLYIAETRSQFRACLC